MTNLGQKLYVKGQSTLNKLKRDEKGSTAVEFMGIAAVVIVVVMLITNYFDNTGEGLIEGIFSGILGKITSIFTGR